MWRSVGSSMIKNTPTLNGRAVFLGLLTIALVIVAPIGHGRAQGAKPELITFTSGDLALKGLSQAVAVYNVVAVGTSASIS